MTLCEFLDQFLEDMKNSFYNPACQATDQDWEEAILSLETAVLRTHEYLSGFENMRAIPSNSYISQLWQNASQQLREINESLSFLLKTKAEFYMGPDKYFQGNREQFVYKLHDASESLNQLRIRLNRRYDTTYFQNHR
jgi:hypothetical protein